MEDPNDPDLILDHHWRLEEMFPQLRINDGEINDGDHWDKPALRIGRDFISGKARKALFQPSGSWCSQKKRIKLDN